MADWQEFVNGNPRAMRIRIESGDFGVTLFDLPPGGRFRVMAGSLTPRILTDEAPVEVLEGDNIIKIDD